MAYESAPAPLSEERTLTVIGNLTRASGFMGVKQKTYSLIITDRRLIFAELSREKMNETWKQTGNDAKGQGKGLLRQWGAQVGAFDDYHKRYRDMPPEVALAETPGNFAIDRALIRKVKFKSEDRGIGGADNHTDEVIIKTPTERIRLLLFHSLLASVKEAFQAAGLA